MIPGIIQIIWVLYRYLSTECSIQQTADQMQVHRNTINYKLRQIREIYRRIWGRRQE
ncbi:MAG: helix-turn-helix domain-containing protein [Ruminococcus sp.]